MQYIYWKRNLRHKK